MIPMLLTEVAACCGGSVFGAGDTWVSAPADVDSRSVLPGGLFVAVAGENVDGHDFAESALTAGAAAVLCSSRVNGPCVVVDDVIGALGKIARAVIDRLDKLRIVAVTGSQGKTTVKDLLGHALAPLGSVVTPVGSFNNELGVPLTALRVTEETRHLVIEMGARGIGHIQRLCHITPPDLSVVLNVGTAHLNEFGSTDAIAVAKNELVRALDSSGLAILNDDDKQVRAMATQCRGRVVTFGGHGDVGVEDVMLDEVGQLEFHLRWEGNTQALHVPLIGEHHASNVAAASAVALVEGSSLDTLAQSLANAAPDSPMRLARQVSAQGIVVLDDSYNANPESMAAGLRALIALAHPPGQPRHRACAVLGEMLELGPVGWQAHRDTGLLCQELGVDDVVVVGHGAVAIADGAGDIAALVSSPDEAVELLKSRLGRGDVVLVKASRASRLERVVDSLLEG